MSEDQMLNAIDRFINYLSNYYSPTFVYASFLLMILLLFFFLWQEDGYRPFQMRKITKKYGLRYTRVEKSYSVKDMFIPDYKENIIEGGINGKKILIYDRIVQRSWLRMLMAGTVLGIDKFTVAFVDGSKKQFPYSLRGIVSVKKIDSFLADLVK